MYIGWAERMSENRGGQAEMEAQGREPGRSSADQPVSAGQFLGPLEGEESGRTSSRAHGAASAVAAAPAVGGSSSNELELLKRMMDGYQRTTSQEGRPGVETSAASANQPTSPQAQDAALQNAGAAAEGVGMAEEEQEAGAAGSSTVQGAAINPRGGASPAPLSPEAPAPAPEAAALPSFVRPSYEEDGRISLTAAPAAVTLGLKELKRAAEATSGTSIPRLLCRAIGAPAAPGQVIMPESTQPLEPGRWPSPPGVATNGIFLCYLDNSGTAIQVVAQATMALVSSLSSKGARVVDFALQGEDNHLLAAFDNGRVIVVRLTNEKAAPRVLLQFDRASQPQAVLWHPMNNRVFVTLHPQQCLLWHLQLIVQFVSMKGTGYMPIENEAVQTALHVTEGLIAQAAVEAQQGQGLRLEQAQAAGPRRLQELLQGAAAKPSPSMAQKDGLLFQYRRVAMSPEGNFLAASTDREIWLWQVSKDDKSQSLPSLTCVQCFPLPENLAGPVTHIRIASRMDSAQSTTYALLLVTPWEVILVTLDPRPSEGGKGRWLPYGKLLCQDIQRIRFPRSVSCDIFQPWNEELWPFAGVVIALELEEPEALFLYGELGNGIDGLLLPELRAMEIHVPLASNACKRVSAIRSFERSSRAKAVPEGAEAHTWAIVGVSPGGPGASACWCVALPWVQAKSAAGRSPISTTDQVTQDADRGEGAGQSATPLPLSEAIANGHEDSPLQPDRAQTKPKKSEADATTIEEVKTLHHFLLVERCDKAVEGILTELRRALPAITGGGSTSSSGPDRARQQREISAALQREVLAYVEQVKKNERAVLGEFDRLLRGPVYQPGTSCLEAAAQGVQREVRRLQGDGLTKAVVSACESARFADCISISHSDGQPTSLEENIAQRLMVPPEELMKVIQSHYTDGLHHLIAKVLQAHLKVDCLPAAKRAIGNAMLEVVAQAKDQLDRLISDALKAAPRLDFQRTCSRDVGAAVRREVAQWQEEVARQGGPAQNGSQNQSRATLEFLRRRIKERTSGVQQMLDSAELELKSARAALHRCQGATGLNS